MFLQIVANSLKTAEMSHLQNCEQVHPVSSSLDLSYSCSVVHVPNILPDPRFNYYTATLPTSFWAHVHFRSLCPVDCI